MFGYIYLQRPHQPVTYYSQFPFPKQRVHFGYIGQVIEDYIIYIDELDRNEYPTDASHARFPIIVHCYFCKTFTKTYLRYSCGVAKCFWSIVLLPVLCAGLCCIFLPACKDIRHSCSKCGSKVGVNKSVICVNDLQ